MTHALYYVDARVRHAIVAASPDDAARIVFDTPQRGLASGQILALYEGERLLGGGIYA